MYPPQGGNYVDIPAAFHNRGMGVAFADGRAEIRHWTSPATAVPVSVDGQFRTPNLTTPEARADMEWLRTHSPHR
jgi:prepilin-type processing-associated H-X9-DG protein